MYFRGWERCGVIGRGGRWKEVGKEGGWGEERRRDGGEMEEDGMGRGEGGNQCLLVGDNGDVHCMVT